jgi:hypothetical protein
MRSVTSYLCNTIALIGLAIPTALFAQQTPSILLVVSLDKDATGFLLVPSTGAITPDPNGSAPLSAGVSAPSLPPLTSSAKPVETNPRPLTDRWLDLTTFSHSERYRNQYGDDGDHYFEDAQQRSLLAGKLRLDGEGRYAIGFRASSGRTFNWAYADYAGRGFAASLNNPQYVTDVSDPVGDPVVAAAYAADPAGVALVNGLKSAGWEFYVRELYLIARPVKMITLEFGSFGFERGYSTEITTFDDDGYIAGERVRINDPKHLFFDQVTATSAFFGHIDQPNLFARGDSFSKSNYRQVAVQKQLTPRIGISGEYNWISNNARTSTTREAIVADIKETKVFDKVRLEGYQMLSHVFLQGNEERQRQGFALVGEKTIGNLGGDFGFASIDRDYGLYTGSSFMQEVGFSLNGDTYNTGIRIFSHVNYKLTPSVTAFGFYTRITGAMITNLNAQGLNAGLSFDLKTLFKQEKRIF